MANGSPKSTVGPQPPQIDFVKPKDASKDFGVGATEPSATQIEIGLWDNLITPGGTLHLLTAEDQNVIGSDSRRFYIRVRDNGAKGRGSIEVDWWTAFKDSPDRVQGTVQDDPKSVLNLFEVAGSPGVFASRGLMLVEDQADRSVVTNSGILPSDPKLGSQSGDRTDQKSNFRIRRGGMHSFVVASYTAKTAKAKAVTVVAPVFLPANKKLMPVQVYIVRDGKGGNPVVPPADICVKDLRAITETYEKIGIWFWALVTSADKANSAVEKVKGPPGAEYELCVVDPPAGVDPAKVDVKDVAALGRAFPAGAPNIMRLFFVSAFAFTDLSFKPLGRAFGITPDPSPAAGCTAKKDPQDTAGIALVQSNRGDDFTAAHELGHILTDKDKVRKASNPNDVLQTCVEESHYRADSASALRVNMNLMNGNGAKTPAQKFLDPKRIWDEFDDDFVDQILNIRASKFLR